MKNSLPIELNLPDGFLEPEVRCGYEVSIWRKKIWAVELDLISKVLEICRKHKINVQVFAGTLLGAIRHKGFIPWDDDADLCMDRANYEKFCKVAVGELQYPYFLQTIHTDPKYFLGYARLRNSGTTGIITGQESLEYNGGIFIDIFVLDGVLPVGWRRRVQRKLMMLVRKLIAESGLTRDRARYNTMASCVCAFTSVIWRAVGIERLFKLYNKIMSCYTKRADMIGIMSLSDRILRYAMRKQEYAQSIELNFENIMVPVPMDYNTVLKRIYGDFMKFPPFEERGKWHDGEIAFNPDVPYKDFLKKRV